MPRGDGYLVILSNDDNEEVIRRTIGQKEEAKYAVGAEVTLGVFSITIESDLSASHASIDEDSTPRCQEDAASNAAHASFSFSKRIKSESTFLSKPTIAASTFQINPSLDPILERHMHPHQVSGVEFLLSALEKHSGAVLADAMGLGKTLTSIAVLWAYVKGRRGKGIIVCPSSLVDNWRKEVSCIWA